MTPRHRRLGVFVGIALLLPLLTASTSFADPLADKRAEAAKIQQQLEQQGEKVSVLAERSNRAQIKVSEVEANLDKAQADLARSDERMQAVKSRMADIAVLAYVHGGNNAFIGKLVRGGKDDMVVRTQYLRVTAADQRQAIGDMRAAREDFQLHKAQLESDRKAAADAASAARSASQAAEDAENAQRAVLSRVNGEIGDLVAAEQARKDAEEAAKHPAPAPVLADMPRITEAPKAQTPAAQSPAAAAASPTTTTTAATEAAPPASGKGATAVAEAKKQLGKPYVYGGAGPDSFDCSGLTAWAWRAAGVSLSHSAYDQWFETTRVPVSAVQPGDLLFFGDDGVESIHHVAIYAGGGEMVEASTTGTPVRMRSWRSVDLVGAGRPG